MRWMISWLCAAAVLAAPSTAGAQPSNEKPTSEAQALLRIVCDPASGLAPESLIMPLLVGGGLTQQAIAKTFPDAAKQSPKVQVSVVPIGPSGANLTAKVQVKSYDERIAADKLIAPLAEALAKTLSDLDVGHKRDQEQLKECEREVLETADQLLKEREAIRKLADVLHYVPPQLAEQRLLRAEAAAQTTKVELEGLKMRRETLMRQIAEQAKRVDDGAANDPVVKELEKVVQVREISLHNTNALVRKGSITNAAAMDAEVAVAEARAELAKYKRAATQTAGGERLAELQRRLDDTEAQIAETQVKGDFQEKQLEAASSAIGGSVALEHRKLQIELLEQRYRAAVPDVYQLRTKLRGYQPPQVTIIPTS